MLLLEDIETVKPHIFASVPRLYNRIYDRVMGTIRESNPISRTLFNAGYASKRAAILAGDLSGGRMAPFWDRLVFSKVKARLGGGRCMPIIYVVAWLFKGSMNQCIQNLFTTSLL